MRRIRAVTLSLLSVLGIGCYEDQMAIKKWAEKNSKAYYEKVIRIDARARTHKVAKKMAISIQKEDQLIGSFIQRLNELTSDIPASHAELRSRWITSSSKFIQLRKDIRIELTSSSQVAMVCEDYFRKHLIQPIDLGSIALQGGEESFHWYLGLTFGGEGIELDIQPGQNRHLIEKAVDTLINEPVAWLLASEEEREALDQAMKLFKKNMPSVAKRTQWAIEECRAITDPLTAVMQEQSRVLQKLESATESAELVLSQALTRQYLDLKAELERRHQERVQELEIRTLQRRMEVRRQEFIQTLFDRLEDIHIDWVRSLRTQVPATVSVELFDGLLNQVSSLITDQDDVNLKSELSRFKRAQIAIKKSLLSGGL